MANADNSSWLQIQAGVRDTEKLIGQKQYNLAMIKARQTLEFMVKIQTGATESSGIDLIEMIDKLYTDKVISKTTCEHYHKIRMIGNKAAHDNDNNAYNANMAYHLLSQEVYTFASDYKPKRKSSHTKRNTGTSTGGVSRRSANAGSRNRSRAFSMADLIKIAIPVVIIILLLIIIRIINPFKTTETLPATTEITTIAKESLTPEPSSEEPTTEAVPVQTYTTTTSLNVRSAPSRDGDILTTLPSGSVVDYVGAYDSEWSIINYNGAQAYVASAYLSAN